ncbi:MAG: hypothetical protein ACT4OP_08860 [Actinomycetota bacterium]
MNTGRRRLTRSVMVVEAGAVVGAVVVVAADVVASVSVVEG